MIAHELDAGSTIALEVVREGGAFGQVEVSWELTGEHMEGEISPISETVSLPTREIHMYHIFHSDIINKCTCNDSDCYIYTTVMIYCPN